MGSIKVCLFLKISLTPNIQIIMLLQEHSLTPANMYNFDRHFPDCFNFGCSAMMKCVESGMLTGRPFGGVVTLINNNLRKNYRNC